MDEVPVKTKDEGGSTTGSFSRPLARCQVAIEQLGA